MQRGGASKLVLLSLLFGAVRLAVSAKISRRRRRRRRCCGLASPFYKCLPTCRTRRERTWIFTFQGSGEFFFFFCTVPIWTLGLWIGEAYEDAYPAIFSIPRQMHIEEIVSRDMDMEVFVLLRLPVFFFFSSFSVGFLLFLSLGPLLYEFWFSFVCKACVCNSSGISGLWSLCT